MSDAAWGAIAAVLGTFVTAAFAYFGKWTSDRQKALQNIEQRRQENQLQAQRQEFEHLRDIIDELIERVERAEDRANRADERADRAETRAEACEQREASMRIEISRLHQRIAELEAQ